MHTAGACERRSAMAYFSTRALHAHCMQPSTAWHCEQLQQETPTSALVGSWYYDLTKNESRGSGGGITPRVGLRVGIRIAIGPRARFTGDLSDGESEDGKPREAAQLVRDRACRSMNIRSHRRGIRATMGSTHARILRGCETRRKSREYDAVRGTVDRHA